MRCRIRKLCGEEAGMTSFVELLGQLKAALDEHDRLIRPATFDDPRIAEQDPLNSVVEPEGDATGDP